ncbi:MAG: hypothetical protein ABID38_04220 [Candidatus Diapherotrites archaeon]
MKGEEAEYVIPLRKVFLQPKTKRSRKAVEAVRRFAAKHTHMDKVLVSNDLNEIILEKSHHIPRKLEVVFWKDGDILRVYAKGGKELANDKKLKAEKEKEKKKKKDEKKGKEEAMTDAQKAVKEEEDKKKADKKERERASEKAAIKRK